MAEEHDSPIANRAARSLDEARAAFRTYGLAFFLAGVMVGALIVQILYMALS
jgi:hypothetical protein